MTLDLNLPVTLSADGGDHVGFLLRVREGEQLCVLLEAPERLPAIPGVLHLKLEGDPMPALRVAHLNPSDSGEVAWSHTLRLADNPEPVLARWKTWLNEENSDTDRDIAYLDRLMGSSTDALDPYGFHTDDSAETRDVDDGERQSLLAALRDSMSQPATAADSAPAQVSEETGDWLDGLGDDLGALGGRPASPSLSEADFEALLLEEDSSMVTLAMEGDEDDWTEDSVNWQQDTEDTLLEGPATLAIEGGYERLAVLSGPPEFQDQKDVPDDFEPAPAVEEALSSQVRLEARQEAELAALLQDDSSTSSESSEEGTGFADLVDEIPPAGFSVPASAEDFAELLDSSEPEAPEAPSDPRYERDDRGLHVHWETVAALSRDYEAELSRKRLTVYRDDAPSPGTPMTLWLHLPDSQVLALSARLAGADADRFELRLDLPLVTKGKLKRVARS